MNQRQIHARIAELHRELAEAYGELAGEGLEVRRPVRLVSQRQKPTKEPTDLQRAKAERILRAHGDIR